MALRYVRDFVGEHAGKFIFAVDQGQESARDINTAARNGESVRFLLVHYVESKIPAFIVGRGSQALAELPHVSFRERRGIESDLLLDQFGGFGPLLDVALGC